MRLIKLLYIADRESLRETGAPITGDSAFAMRNGPVLSETYDLIKGEHVRAAEWSRFFENSGYLIHLEEDPGTGLLSKYEVAKLNAVEERFHTMDDWDVADSTHEFPEYQRNDPGNSSKPIPATDILEAVGRLDDIESIQKDAQAQASLDRALRAK